MINGMLKAKKMQLFTSKADEAYKDSGFLIMETVTNIRTVASFGNYDILYKILDDKL